MTVSLNSAPPAKTATPEAATPTTAKNSRFDKLIDTADLKDGAADPMPEAPAKPPVPQADQSLEALLAALKLTLTPGAALLVPTPKKAGEGEKAATTLGKPGKDGEPQDPAAALLAALTASSLPAPVAGQDIASRARQAVDDVLGKPAARATLIAFGDATPAPFPLPPSIDLATLAGAAAVKSPDQAPPTAQLERLLDTARDAAWLDRLSQDIAASAGAGDKMRFRMMPPNLGALDVSVERQAAGLNVSMTTHTADARNLIADSRQQMVDSLKAQGVPLIQLSLQTAGEEQAGHRPPTFFNHLIEAAPLSGTELAAQPVEATTAERVGRFA